MTDGLTFDDDMTRRAVELYETDDVARRRSVVMDAAGLQPGEAVLDIGAGPGYLACQMADAVGPDGRVHAVDISEAMLAVARRKCEDMPWITFDTGDAADLPVPDAGFDVAVSVQVFEYVPRIESALAEMQRALRPGGRAVVVATDWDSMVWHSTDAQRTEHVLAAFSEHSAFTDLPRSLGSRLVQAGFELQEIKQVPQVNATYDRDGFSFHLAGIVAAFVREKKLVSTREIEAWREDLEELGKRGEYFFLLNQFLYRVAKPD